jgi:hypothetical protein
VTEMAEPDYRIGILLHEYDSLRAEILSRYGAEFQVIAACAAYFVGLVTAWLAGWQTDSPMTYVSLALLALVALIGLMTMSDTDVTRASWRIREIEARVNELAGERLLVWETYWGMGGGLGRLFARRPNIPN